MKTKIKTTAWTCKNCRKRLITGTTPANKVKCECGRWMKHE